MQSDVTMRLVLGLIISSAIGVAAFRRASLSRSGAFGAVLIGTPLFGFGGWIAGVLLMTFFISSSALSHYKAQSRSKRDAARFFDKGGRRDLGQALANGGAAAFCAVAFGLSDSPSAQHAWQAAMLGALAAATADTWATELGVLSQHPPVLITTLQPATPGRGGAVSGAGLVAACAGATLIAVVFSVLNTLNPAMLTPALGTFAPSAPIRTAIAVIIGGAAGSVFDSLLGATVQAQYYNAHLTKPTEKSCDENGIPHALISGWRWMNNDLVNFLASIAGAGITVLIASIG